jgi:hypothetical protein
VEDETMTARDVDGWLARVDEYVDGTLGDKDALRLRLAAEKSDELREEIAQLREFHAALGAMAVESPGPGFEAPILESVPLDRYASAPRRNPIVVALGEWAPSPLQRVAHRLGKGLSALAAAWILALIVSSTALQGPISGASLRLGEQLRAWADASAGNSVLHPVARLFSAAYDASFGVLGSMDGALGLGLTIFLLGALVGGLAFGLAARRRAAVRGRTTHQA